MSSSMYDNFRAPQYVDFGSNPDHYDDSFDSSMFFERDLENLSMVTTVGGARVSHGSTSDSSFSSISENDRTLTPNHAMEVSDRESYRPVPTPGRPADCNGFSSTPKFQHGRGTKVQINVIPPTPSHPLVWSKNDSMGSVTSEKSLSQTVKHNTQNHEKSSHNKPSFRRRSLSESHDRSAVCCDNAANQILNHAMKALELSSRKSAPANKLFSTSEIFSKSISQQVKPENGNQKKKGTDRPKRKLSPPPKHVRDYSQQPEKFISMAEHIVKVQNQTPPRFRCLPRTGALKKVAPAMQVKGSVSASNKEQSGLISTITSSAPVKAPQEGEQGGKMPHVEKVMKAEPGVKVARWAPRKVEPFQLAQYKKREVATNVVKEFKAKPSQLNTGHKIRMGKVAMKLSGDTCELQKIYIGNFGTPLNKQTRPKTKVQPFSFDQRDQELIARKLARQKQQQESHQTCCHTKRQRSKSQGPELDKKNIKEDLRVHHARVPTVLYKEQFKPLKSNAMPTKPIGFQLRSEQRAKERAAFDQELKEKEERREMLLRELEEKREREAAMSRAKLRKELVHKARPVPAFRSFKVQPSDANLTEPSTPTFMRRSARSTLNEKRGVNLTENDDEPMEVSQ